MRKIKSDYDDYMEKLVAFSEVFRDEDIAKTLKQVKDKKLNKDTLEVLEKCEEKLQDEYVKKNKADLERGVALRKNELEKVKAEIRYLDKQMDELYKKKRGIWGFVWDFLTKEISNQIKEKIVLRDKKKIQETLCMDELNSAEIQADRYDDTVRTAQNCIKFLKSNAKQQLEIEQKRYGVVELNLGINNKNNNSKEQERGLN